MLCKPNDIFAATEPDQVFVLPDIVNNNVKAVCGLSVRKPSRLAFFGGGGVCQDVRLQPTFQRRA